MRYYQGMEKMDYGVKAPKLDDGSLLLQELVLTAEQSGQIKFDKDEIEKARKHTFVSSVWLFILDNLLFMTGICFLFHAFSDSASNAALPMLGTFFFILSFVVGRHRRNGTARLAERMVEIFQVSKIAPEVTNVFKRYMPGEAGVQCYTYVDLLMKDDVEVGNSKSYRVRLDTSKAENYVVREVVLPETA